MNRWRFDRLIGLIFGMLIMGATTGALATSNGGNSHQEAATQVAAPEASYVYSDPTGCLPSDMACFVIDEAQSPNSPPMILIRGETGEYTPYRQACPSDPRKVAALFVLGSDPNGWSGPINEGGIKLYTYHASAPRVVRVAYGRLDTGRGTVTVNTGYVFIQDASWRCLTLGNTNIRLPGEPSVTKPLTVGEVRSWCSNCGGTFDVIEGGNAIVYTSDNLGSCPAGFDMPQPVSYQAGTINGQRDGQVDGSNVLVERVCKATFRLWAIRI